MNSLNGFDGLLGSTSGGADSGGTMADKALQNLMGSIDSFGITGSAAKPTANHPFESNNIMSNATLGEMKIAKSGLAEKKPVMNSPSGGALVPIANQSGNWGGFGVQQQPQYNLGGSMGMSGSMSMQQPPQYPMSGGYGQQQPQMGYGQQMQQPSMGMGQSMQHQPFGYGASPQYGQQQYQQQQPPQWGAPSYQ
jgi:hypothetical protein